MTSGRARHSSTAGRTGDGPPELPSLDGPRLRAVPAERAHVAEIQSCFAGAPDYFARTEGGPPGPDAA